MAKASKRLSAKRVIALVTAFLFVLSGVPVSSITAQAAVKKPTIAKSATVKVGQSKKIKISKGSYKIVSVKVSSSKKSIATVKASGKTAIKVTGKKAGKATITTKVKAKKGKTSKTFKLKTKVTVKKASTPKPEAETSKTVNTQDELTAALADSKITEITIGQAATSITIPAGNYSKVDLIVDAPNASITNKGVFKSITIKAIAANTWHEEANGNKIYTDNEKGIRIVLEKGASVESLQITSSTTGEVKIEVAGGSVASIEIAGTEKVDLVLSGDATVGTVKVDAAAKVDVTATDNAKIEKVAVTEKAAGTATSKTVVNIKAEGSASIKEITTSAANSTTNLTANGSADVAKVAVNGNAAASINGTSNKVTVVDITGASKDATVTVNTSTVKIETTAGTDTEKIINNQSGQALKTEEKQADGTVKETTTATDATPSTTPSTGGGNSSGDPSGTPSEDPSEPVTLTVTGVAITASTTTTGSAVTTTPGAITATPGAITATPGAITATGAAVTVSSVTGASVKATVTATEKADNVLDIEVTLDGNYKFASSDGNVSVSGLPEGLSGSVQVSSNPKILYIRIQGINSITSDKVVKITGITLTTS